MAGGLAVTFAVSALASAGLALIVFRLLAARATPALVWAALAALALAFWVLAVPREPVALIQGDFHSGLNDFLWTALVGVPTFVGAVVGTVLGRRARRNAHA
ncbi:MAG: hypothetical protein AAF667_20235 [Pseudomonadota bacterium]